MVGSDFVAPADRAAWLGIPKPSRCASGHGNFEGSYGSGRGNGIETEVPFNPGLIDNRPSSARLCREAKRGGRTTIEK